MASDLPFPDSLAGLVLGLDSGGTKTRLALADRRGGIHGRGAGPGLNPFGAPGWQAALAGHLLSALQVGPVKAAVLGMPFHGEVAKVSAEQVQIASAALGAMPQRVVNDVEAAFVGAFAGGPGALLLAGTGSMVWAGDGVRTLRVGGFGEAFGDEGSAHWIGREALSLASRGADGRLPDAGLGAAVLAACGTDADGLIAWAYGAADVRATIAGLAPVVSTLAEAGNAAALDLLAKAAGHLAEHVNAARSRLGRQDLPWSYAGGVFASSMILRALTRQLGPATPPRLDPLGGAILSAARLAGWDTGPGFVGALGEGLAAAANTS